MVDGPRLAFGWRAKQALGGEARAERLMTHSARDPEIGRATDAERASKNMHHHDTGNEKKKSQQSALQ